MLHLKLIGPHHTLGPKSQDPNRPCDILCCLHYFTVKEHILRKARELGDITLEGSKIQVLADLSKITLDKRCALRPPLDSGNAKFHTRGGIPSSCK